MVIFTDNESVMHMINKSSSSCKTCMVMIRYITIWSMNWNVRVFATHVNTRLNKKADLLSRGKLVEYFEIAKGSKVRENVPSSLWPIPLKWFGN